MNKLLTAAQVVGKGLLTFTKIGATQTAIYSLSERNKNDIRSISGQMERGYKYNVSPKLQKIKVLKGGKQ